MAKTVSPFEITVPGKKTIVEVGHGQMPIWSYLRKLPLDDQSYIGLDVRSPKWPSERVPLYDIDMGRRKIEKRSETGKDCRFIEIDDDGFLPLPSGIASEVYMSLVTNDPRISELIVERLLKEASRIMGAGGCLVIHNGALAAIDRGDVLVDFSDFFIKFKVSRGFASHPDDSSNSISVFLNEAFHPMAPVEYRRFFSDRGYHRAAGIKPGLSHSVLIKK